MPVINLRLGANHSPAQSSFWKLWMLSQQAEKLLADAAGWLPDWSWLFPSEIYVAIVSWFFQTIFTSSDRLQMPSRMRTFANDGTQCVFPAPKHLQSPASSQTCERWKGQSLCKDAQNRQKTAPIWNSRSSIHFFNCEHLELHLECCLALLALHWFNKRCVAMLARPTGIKFFGNRFKDPLLASGMTSLQMKVTKGRLWLRTAADCKEQTRCLSSLVLLSKESMIMGRVQTLPTAQHELHRRSLLCWILAKGVAPCLCRVHGRCSVGPRLIVFRDPGTLSRSDFSCLQLEQLLALLARTLQW